MESSHGLAPASPPNIRLLPNQRPNLPLILALTPNPVPRSTPSGHRAGASPGAGPRRVLQAHLPTSSGVLNAPGGTALPRGRCHPVHSGSRKGWSRWHPEQSAPQRHRRDAQRLQSPSPGEDGAALPGSLQNRLAAREGSRGGLGGGYQPQTPPISPPLPCKTWLLAGTASPRTPGAAGAPQQGQFGSKHRPLFAGGGVCVCMRLRVRGDFKHLIYSIY